LGQSSPALTSFMLRHAGPFPCLCGCSGLACHRRHEPMGRIADWRSERAFRRSRRLPSLSSFLQTKQRLTRSSGAELKRGSCAPAVTSAASVDWWPVPKPRLRGAIWRVRLPRRWFPCNFFSRLVIIVRQCGPIDLVAVYPRQL